VGDPAKTVFALRLALVVVSIVAIGLIVTVILLLTRGNGPASGTTSPQPNASAATTQEATPMYLTQYIAVDSGATKEDAIIIELHTDYQCPWCGRAEQIYGEALHDLAISGDVDLRIHLRTLVGDQIIGNDSSRRAAAAAVCANDVDAFWAYHSTIFANQPEEGVGFTDEQLLVDFPAQAGISGQALQDFQTCYQSGASQEQVQAMEDEGSQAGINGTPAFYVNGLPVNFDLQPSADSITSMNATDLLAALQNL
jgi:protein-disulfide isomerase